MDGEPYLRMMKPLVTDRECLQCHQQQGYREGDIRGGISVMVPMEPLYRLAQKRIRADSLSFAFLWLVGLGGIMMGAKRIRLAMEQRDRRNRRCSS